MRSPIGVIDSGLGGVTVLKDLVKLLPNENYIYIGDTLNNPYGDKTVDELRNITHQLVDYLVQQNIKMLVIACNTITSLFLDELKEKYPFPVIGIITPTASVANSVTEGTIGVIATKRTIESEAYQKQLQGTVYALATPTLVPLIENNQINTEHGLNIIREAISPLMNRNIDTLVLGCTHYPLIKDQLQSILPLKHIVSSGEIVSKVVYYELKRLNLLNDEDGSIVIHVTKNKESFDTIIREWFHYSYTIDELTL